MDFCYPPPRNHAQNATIPTLFEVHVDDCLDVWLSSKLLSILELNTNKENIYHDAN